MALRVERTVFLEERTDDAVDLVELSPKQQLFLSENLLALVVGEAKRSHVRTLVDDSMNFAIKSLFLVLSIPNLKDLNVL